MITAGEYKVIIGARDAAAAVKKELAEYREHDHTADEMIAMSYLAIEALTTVLENMAKVMVAEREREEDYIVYRQQYHGKYL